MTKPRKFEDDLRIDPDALDVECLKQSELFFGWAQLAIAARGQVDRAELKLEVVEAEMQMEVRRKPHRFKLDEKPTEAAVKAAVKSSEQYKSAYEEYLKARDEAALLDKAVAAMDMRKRMLEELIKLHGMSYFAGPSTPRDLGKAWLKQRARSEERVSEKQRSVIRRRRED